VNTLRVKLILLLAVAIVSVVALMTLVMIYVFAPAKARHAVDPVADMVVAIVKMASTNPDAAALVANPAAGRVYETTTEYLRGALAERGFPLAVTVSRNGPGTPLTVSIPIMAQGWLLMPIPNLPPPRPPWRALLKWLAFITFGATAIAVFVANRMVKPLVLLENAVASVGPDGILPHLPERGPAEVRVTAKALNSLSSRLRAAIESRMRLVAAAGHDLRTPITRLRLRAEFIEDDDERARWLNDLDELERIADSAILLVREESGKVPPEPIRLDELVGSVAAELRDQKFDVAVANTQPVTVRASRLALSRALRNLMINAATHGVRARVSVANGVGGTARVIIEDEGPGIPPALLGQVFEPFFRADPGRRQTRPGAGLGLTIAREIVRRAGGDISIANNPGHGLTQLIELPQGEPVGANPATPERAAS
jgi:signal transduction histidine kinase